MDDNAIPTPPMLCIDGHMRPFAIPFHFHFMRPWLPLAIPCIYIYIDMKIYECSKRRYKHTSPVSFLNQVPILAFVVPAVVI